MSSMSEQAMTIEQFEGLLDVHGSELGRWPRLHRERATRLLRTEPAAQALLAEYRLFEAQLSELPRLEASPELQRRVAEIPARNSRSSVGWSVLLSRWWMPVLAGAFAVAVGGVSGWSSYSEDDPEASAEGWEDASALALAMDLEEGWE